MKIMITIFHTFFNSHALLSPLIPSVTMQLNVPNDKTSNLKSIHHIGLHKRDDIIQMKLIQNFVLVMLTINMLNFFNRIIQLPLLDISIIIFREIKMTN